MSSNRSLSIHPEARECLNAAMQATNGLRLKFPNLKAATRFANKCYTIRSRERRASERRHNEDHPQYGQSPWEDISIRIATPEGPEGETILDMLPPHVVRQQINAVDPLTGEKIEF